MPFEERAPAKQQTRCPDFQLRLVVPVSWHPCLCLFLMEPSLEELAGRAALHLMQDFGRQHSLAHSSLAPAWAACEQQLSFRSQWASPRYSSRAVTASSGVVQASR